MCYAKEKDQPKMKICVIGNTFFSLLHECYQRPSVTVHLSRYSHTVFRIL